MRDRNAESPPDPFDCQVFHELCMDYRGAQYGSEINSPQQAYERLQAYCRAELAKVRS